MIRKLMKAMVTASAAAALLTTPATADAAPLDGFQDAYLYVGGGEAYVWKTWHSKNSKGEFDGEWLADPGPGIHVRIYHEGFEVFRTPDGTAWFDVYQDVKKFSMKACNATRCSKEF
ncbi:hypothetical protein [Kibdelosporangium aridum]|uniref:hypothetical protein n=1 Tax=Kibdelosporangium aridum TaxID=2030 RepID=UPI00163BDB65|nr:hypothetical protein [Kibdelosporangium aridum]